MSRESRITAWERLSIIAAFGLVLVAAVGGLAWYAKRIDDNGHKTAHALRLSEAALKRERAQERTLRSAQIANCGRGNERTVAENVSNLADWRFFSSTATLLKVTLTHRPPGQPAPTPQQISETKRFIGGLEDDARDKVWHHLIANCEYAIDHPALYRLPAPVAFSKHAPPKSALHIGSVRARRKTPRHAHSHSFQRRLCRPRDQARPARHRLRVHRVCR